METSVMTARRPTRGYRNNNPCNIRWRNDIAWQGQIGHDEKNFVRFSNRIYGYRAVFALLRSYARLHNITTVAAIISRFAPPSENATPKYIADVCKMAQLTPDTTIDYRAPEARRMVKAMAYIESLIDADDGELTQAQKSIL